MARMQKYGLFSTMDQEPRLLSGHRSIEAAGKAKDRLNRAVRKGNPGGNSYYPTAVLHGDGTPLTDEEHLELCQLYGWNC